MVIKSLVLGYGNDIPKMIPIRTNSISNPGANHYTLTLTNVVNSGTGQQFYILQVP